ncbi:MAG TPA: ribonuclease HI family protein [Actinomycetota bacterium]|jgi:ribonuclease HI
MNDAYRLRTDGGARGNPGPAGIGIVLEAPGGEVVAEVAKGIGHATNNVAEYQALLEGLSLAAQHGARRLDVFSDSLLMVEQMKGRYKVRNPGLRPLFERARQLVRDFDKVTFTAVRRERNRAADTLANQGMDEQEAAGGGSVGAQRGRGLASEAETGAQGNLL